MREMTGENNKKNFRLLQSASILEEALGTKVKVSIGEDLYAVELQQSNAFDGKPEVKYLYGFTEETRGKFKKILKSYDEVKIEGFINHIESDIGNFVSVKHGLGDQQSFHVQEVEDIIESLERAEKCLLKIRSGRLRVPLRLKHSYTYKFKNPDDPLSVDLFEEVKDRCNYKTRTALRSLQDLSQDLKSAVIIERRRQGHPNADENDLAFQIAKWFKEFIGSPRPYTGPYPKIVKKCFEICDSNCKNKRTKAILDALRKLAES